MIDLPVNSKITVETQRDEYSTRFILRTRRAWKKLSPEDRQLALLQSADALEVLAAQMRAEAIGEDAPALNWM